MNASAVNYQKGCMTANLHAGTTLGGKFRIADRHNHHPKTFDLDSAPYAGGEVVFKF